MAKIEAMSDKPARLTAPPEGYADWLAYLKGRIHSAQQRATLAVNRELVLLYWQMGRDILARQAEQGWGAKVIERLAHDLRAAFPEMKGFSPCNLKYMRAFAEAWRDEPIVQAPLAQITSWESGTREPSDFDHNTNIPRHSCWVLTQF
ncbi:MAG: DUF1016 N-terminal domain-containing protein [Gallionella sp.]